MLGTTVLKRAGARLVARGRPVLAVGLIVLGGLGFTAPAQAVPMLSLDLVPGGTIDSALGVEIGDTFMVDIVLGDPLNPISFNGLDIGLTFDTDFLSVESFVVGSGFMPDIVSNGFVANTNASLSVFFFGPAFISSASPVSIAKVTFKAKKVGMPSLAFFNTQMTDLVTFPLPLNVDASLKKINIVAPQAAPAPAPFALLFAGIALTLCASAQRRRV